MLSRVQHLITGRRKSALYNNTNKKLTFRHSVIRNEKCCNTRKSVNTKNSTQLHRLPIEMDKTVLQQALQVCDLTAFQNCRNLCNSNLRDLSTIKQLHTLPSEAVSYHT